MDTQAPPSNIDAEEAVIGSLLIDPTAIPLVASTLKSTDFYVFKNAWIYHTIVTLNDKADLFTVASSLADMNLLDECGGDAYLAQLTVNVPTALNVEAYADMVRRTALSRRIIDACSAIARDAWQKGNVSAEELIARAQGHLIDAVASASVRKQQTIEEASDEFFANFSESLYSGKVSGIPTGISGIDNMVAGWKPTRLTVIGANTGHGKTTLMLNTVLHAAKQGHRSMFVSLEMPVPDLIESMVSNDAAIDMAPQSLFKLSPEAKERTLKLVLDSRRRIDKLPLHMLYMPGASPVDLIYEAKRIETQHGHVELIAFDYLQIASAPRNAKVGNREQEVSAIALGLKQAAGELNAHVLTGSQINESGDVRESRAPTHHADTVIYLKRTDEITTNYDMMPLTAEFWKNRKGKTGQVDLIFNKAIARIAMACKKEFVDL